jgi:hypothetical protein
MSLIAINWKPDRKVLVEFSEFGMFFLGMVAAPLAYFRGQSTLAATLWVAAVAGRLIGLVRPQWLKPVFVGMMVITWPIGWVVSHASLAFLYYGVITPIGVFMRLAGRDSMNRRFDPSAKTYWEPYNPDRGMDRYLRQF